MKRGQAFDTMMLVVSVIVALAILAVLLNIFPNLPFPGSDYKDTVRKELKAMHTQGYGVSVPQKVTVPQGSSFFRGEAIAGLPLKTEDVGFFCDDSSICNGDPLQLQDDTLRSSAKIEVFLAVCANTGRAAQPNYCVSFARKPADASDSCIEACEIS